MHSLLTHSMALLTYNVQLVFVSRILTLLTLGFAKCSIILFLRLFFKGTINKAWSICNALLISIGCWTAASVLAVSISCHPSGALHQERRAQCPGDVSEQIKRNQLSRLTSRPAHAMEGSDRVRCLPRGHPSYDTNVSVPFCPNQSHAEAHYIRSLRPSNRVSLT